METLSQTAATVALVIEGDHGHSDIWGETGVEGTSAKWAHSRAVHVNF